MGQLNDHVQPEGPGLLLHRPVTQGDDHLVDIGDDPGIIMKIIVKASHHSWLLDAGVLAGAS